VVAAQQEMGGKVATEAVTVREAVVVAREPAFCQALAAMTHADTRSIDELRASTLLASTLAPITSQYPRAEIDSWPEQCLEARAWLNVPAGYLTDGDSVPRVFWSLIPPWGAYG
jgi:hypothetical protein